MVTIIDRVYTAFYLWSVLTMSHICLYIMHGAGFTCIKPLPLVYKLGSYVIFLAIFDTTQGQVRMTCT